MSEYIKLAEAPVFVCQSPHCGSCSVDLEYEDGWVCPVCGTSWGADASDGDAGELYESWAGVELEGEALGDDAAFQAGIAHDRAEREKLFTSLGWCKHGAPKECVYNHCSGGTR